MSTPLFTSSIYKHFEFKEEKKELEKKEITVGASVYHKNYGRGTVLEIDVTKESAYLLKFEKLKKYFKDGKWWCNKKLLTFSKYKIYEDYKNLYNQDYEICRNLFSTLNTSTGATSASYPVTSYSWARLP